MPPVPDRRPPRFPTPQFPVRRPALFATTPPVIFLPILGLLWLGLALRQACAVTGLPGAPVEAALGALAGLWLFAMLALTAKLIRRPAVLSQDLRPLPGRAGLAAATMSGMAFASVVLPYAPRLALILVTASLAGHALLALFLARHLSRDVDGKMIDPTWQLSFAGFAAGAPVLADLGWQTPARMVFAFCLLAAVLIWFVSLVQLTRRIPPAPLRPLLALHLVPAALLSTVASLTDQPVLAAALLALAILIALALMASARWILAAGFTPLWAALTLPLAAFAIALLTFGAPGSLPGLVVCIAALALIPTLGWKILKLWPGGKLAARTNAATA
jgi:tellurite resistance protein